MNDWRHIGTDTTDSNGRLMYTLPPRDIEPGVYNVKMVVRLVEKRELNYTVNPLISGRTDTSD